MMIASLVSCKTDAGHGCSIDPTRISAVLMHDDETVSVYMDGAEFRLSMGDWHKLETIRQMAMERQQRQVEWLNNRITDLIALTSARR